MRSATRADPAFYPAVVNLADRHSLRSFRHRNFRLLFPASLLSNIGSWAQLIAQDWLVLELTGSAWLLSVVAMLQLLPALLLSIPAGAIADRVDNRKFLMATNAVALLTAAGLGWLVVTGRVEFWHIAGLAFTLGVANAVDGPVRQAFNTQLVGPDSVPNAVSLLSVNINLARMIGPAASGLLITAVGTGPSFLINAASYAFMIFALAAMRPAEFHQEQLQPSSGRLIEGWQYIRARADLQVVLASVFLTAAFGMNFSFFNALMVRNVFDAGAGVYGLMGSVVAAGSLTAAVISTRLEHNRHPRFVLKGALAFAGVMAVLAVSPNLAVYAVLLPLAGFSVLVTLIAGNGAMQVHTDPALRGRVMGWYMMAYNAPLGVPVLGLVVERFGERAAIGTAAALTALPVLAIWLAYRTRLEQPDDPGADAVLQGLGRI